MAAARRAPAHSLDPTWDPPAGLLEPAIFACTVLESCSLVLFAARPTPPGLSWASWHPPCRPLEPAVLAHVLPYTLCTLVLPATRPAPAHLPLAPRHAAARPLLLAVFAPNLYDPCTGVALTAPPAPALLRRLPWHAACRVLYPAVLAFPWHGQMEMRGLRDTVCDMWSTRGNDESNNGDSADCEQQAAACTQAGG